MTMKIKEELLVNGHFNVVKLHINDNGADFQRDICVSKDAVFVLPYDPENKLILIAKEKRFGLYSHTENLETWSSVAGTIDKDLNPDAIALAELEEEAGLKTGTLKLLTVHFSSPGIMSERKYLYTFHTDLSEYKESIFGLESENEEIQTKVVSYTEANEMIKRQEILDLNLMYALKEIMGGNQNER